MEKRRILIFTNHFFPENFRINDAALFLSENNYEVTVLTGIPNYPEGKFYKGYGLFRRNSEILDGIKVFRVPLIPRGKGSKINLILNYSSYLFFLFIWTYYEALLNRFDIVFVHHTSPIFLALPAIFIKKFQKIKLFFWNLDLWPESVVAAGNLSNKHILRYLDDLVKYIYENTDKLLVSSKGFYENIFSKGIGPEKIEYFPNWAEDLYKDKQVSISNDKLTLPSKARYCVMFAGNMGEAQDPKNVYNTIYELSKINESVYWVFVGGGRKMNWLKEEVKRGNLDEYVFFAGQHSINEMPDYFKYANAMLVTLKDDNIFSLTLPARIQAYMASKKPIVGMINGEGARVINEAKCGFVCNSGDYKNLSEIINKMAKLSQNEIEELGLNGFDYYCRFFDKKIVLGNLLKILAEV